MKLSEFEMDVLAQLWQSEPVSAPQLHETVREKRDVTYSTVKTIVDRLEQKGAIERCEKAGRTIFYRSVAKQKDFAKPLLQSFLSRAFGGETRTLFSHLLAEESLNEDDIAYIEKLIKEKKQQLKGDGK